MNHTTEKKSQENVSEKMVTFVQGEFIIQKANEVKLDPALLYEVVIDLSSEGLLTANSINLAAGILIEQLGLPSYFFQNITKESLNNILKSIACSIKIQSGEVTLSGAVSQVQFDVSHGEAAQWIRIATLETRDSMETMLAPIISGHRREYYYSPSNKYFTYVVNPECIKDYPKEEFKKSQFLFYRSSDFTTTPETTRERYEKFLVDSRKSVKPLIEIFNLPQSGETRVMIIDDFPLPQMPIFRRIFAEHGLELKRAYWEPFYTEGEVRSSACSLYTFGELTRKQEAKIMEDLNAFLAFNLNSISDLYVNGSLSLREMLFAGNLVDFTHMFIYKENHADEEIYHSLSNVDQRDAFANRIHESNKTTYVYKTITELVKNNVDLVQMLFHLFDLKFNPALRSGHADQEMADQLREYDRIVSVRFLEDQVAQEIFLYMSKFITSLRKTNFYKEEKRSFAFRFDNGVLDPLVFTQYVYGIYFVNGHYACGSHLRAKEIARGGLRLLRITHANHSFEIDKAVMLNYALGPKAQRLKHKDICESGSKGVIVPHAYYARMGMAAMYDYADGILDLMLPSDRIVSYLDKPEIIFFGPDEGTAQMMDTVSEHARKRGYKYWRTLTTGKSTGIPHDTYGVLTGGDLFGLIDREARGTELQVNGKAVLTTTDTEEIYARIGGQIETSGMTTTCIMTSFRTMIAHYGDREEDLALMMTGGPDGDLGSNQIQCYKGKICLIVDGGSILFDPEGLDKKELMKLAFMRHSNPRANSLLYPREKLSQDGFMVELQGKNRMLPDGTMIEDGAVFHRTFLFNPAVAGYIKKANIQAFIPCGGFKDTVNRNNVKDFVAVFSDLKYIVEGANVFFDDSARRYIARNTAIKQIKDSTANKGGVISSSLAEVLTAFLLGDSYEDNLLREDAIATRWELIRDVQQFIIDCSTWETDTLIKIHEKEKQPLFELSVLTSEQLLALQDVFEEKLDLILADENLVWSVLERYIPGVLVRKLGRQQIVNTLNSSDLQAYRNAILTKKLASMAFYRFALEWEPFLEKVEKNFTSAVKSIVQG